jgi:hypothetical protein
MDDIHLGRDCLFSFFSPSRKQNYCPKIEALGSGKWGRGKKWGRVLNLEFLKIDSKN